MCAFVWVWVCEGESACKKKSVTHVLHAMQLDIMDVLRFPDFLLCLFNALIYDRYWRVGYAGC